jgi:hypothetical protein
MVLRWMQAVCVGAVLLGVCGAAWGESAESKMEKGEVLVGTKAVEGSEIPAVIVRGIFHAPPEKVWALIEKCADYKTTMQRVERSKEVSRKGNKVVCEVEIDLPWPLDNLVGVTEATHTVQPGTLYKRAWTLVSGDYDVNEGSWVLKPYGDGTKTLVVYTAHVETKTAVPDDMKAKAQRDALPDLFEHLRKQVEGK